MIAILAVALITVGALSPGGREAIEHYRCSKRDEARAEAEWKVMGATLKEGKSTKADVRQFLENNFTDLPISESETEISAGRMIFFFDQDGILTESLQEVGCPIAFQSKMKTPPDERPVVIRNGDAPLARGSSATLGAHMR